MDDLKKILIGIVVLLALLCSYLYTLNGKLRKDYYREVNNVKTYELENAGLKDTCRVLKLTSAELKNSKDNTIKQLNRVIDSMGIKYKKLELLYSRLSLFQKTVYLNFHDTIFINNLNVDTLIKYPYYTCDVKLRYPNYVEITPTIQSDLNVMFVNRKETINPPSKLFFIRWFLKKQTVVEAVVIELNPFITTELNKFIQIIK